MNFIIQTSQGPKSVVVRVPSTEWSSSDTPFCERYIDNYCLFVTSLPGEVLWSCRSTLALVAEGTARTVSAAKRQCMRAMNRHRKESQP